MYETLLITFREGLEAFLIVAVATLFLRKTARLHLLSAVRSGLLAALLGSFGLGIVLARVGAFSPTWEGVLALFAAAAVLWCVVHMRKMGKQMGKEVAGGLDRVSVLDSSKAWWGVFGFTVFMVGREGVETATMLAALAGNRDAQPMLVGGLIGTSLAALVAWAWTRYGRQVNLARFFNVTAVFMLVFAAMLVLKGFHEFTEGNLIPGIDNAYWHIATEPLAEGDLAQALSLALVLTPTLWLAFTHWRDRNNARIAPSTR